MSSWHVPDGKKKDIVEWLLYHRTIGFDHVYLYCNDDTPIALHNTVKRFTLGSNPFVTFHWHKTVDD